jgi:hypothetical protein
MTHFQAVFSAQRPFSADPTAQSAQPFSCHPGPYANYASYHQPNWQNFGYNGYDNFGANYPNNWSGEQWRQWNNWGQPHQQLQAQPVLQNSLGPVNPNAGNIDVSYQRTLDYVQQCQSWSNGQAHKF